jgi:ElaB/YqjD/DUF883 family membrane-anchored ribosome-binding protein
MDTTSTPYSPRPPGSTRSAAETATDAARGTVDTVKSAAAEAFDRSQAAVSNAGQAANDVAAMATKQMKSLTSELEAMARRNPLGTIIGAIAIGFFVGFVARDRI